MVEQNAENVKPEETAPDYQEYNAALRQRIKEQEARGAQVDFADFIAARGTRDQARYWLHACLTEERTRSAALEARVAALEDALQGFVNEAEGWFDEYTPAALLAEARALLQNGGAK